MSTPRELAFRRAASVLWQFAPDDLQPDDTTPAEPGEARALLGSSVVRLRRGRSGGATEHWTLRDVLRPSLLSGFEADELARLRGRNASITSREQELVDRWLAGPDPELREYDLEQLAVVSRIITWFDTPPAHFPPAGELEPLRAHARFREPLRALVAQGFHGRGRELETLHRFIVEDDPPPSMVIHGIGGIGKSTLAARFLKSLLETGDHTHVLVYVDFDNPTVTINDAMTLIAEILGQAAAQRADVPALSTLVERAAKATLDLSAADGRGPGRALATRASVEELALSAGEVLRSVNVERVTIVLDTFEEMQFASIEHQRRLDELLGILNKHLPGVRAIVVSRASLSPESFAHVEIGDLDAEATSAFLAQRGVKEPAEVAAIFDVAGGNPLSLKLAAAAVQRDGVKSLDGIARRDAVQQELIQGQLYRRILEHLHGDEVQALAHPGLVVRRVTPDVIQQVLAQPCGVSIPTRERAEELFQQLAREVSLVRVARDGALEHRPDVRRIMLPLLYKDQPVRSREIHERAAKYYSERTDKTAIVEEAYHRLAIGESEGPWRDRLTKDAWRRLGASLEELPRSAWPMIASYANIDLPPEQWESAHADDRERRIAVRIEELLRRDQVEDAVALSDDNPPSSERSVLWRWRGRAFRLVGRLEEALEAFERSAATLLGPPEEAAIDRDLAVEVATKLGDAARAKRFAPTESATADLPTRLDPSVLEPPASARFEELAKTRFRWFDDEDLRKVVHAVIEAPNRLDTEDIAAALTGKLASSGGQSIRVDPGTIRVEPRISGELLLGRLNPIDGEPPTPSKLEAVLTGGRSTRAATAYATAMRLNEAPLGERGNVPLLDWLNEFFEATASEGAKKKGARMGYFSQSEIADLHTAIVNAGHLGDGVWRGALSGLLPGFRAVLDEPVNSGPVAFANLQRLNQTGRLVDGSIPIEVTLASLRVLSPVEAVTRLAVTLLAKLEAKGPGWAGASAPPVYKNAAGMEEAYTGDSDDTLPFDYLHGGHVAGGAVAKLLVPRFEEGQHVAGPMGPRRFNGTGWFVAKDLLVTNFHVVCAREGDEADPSADDLEKQIAGIEVQLNYDRDKAEPLKTTVIGAVVLGARGGSRDYALLRVKPPSEGPVPLRLRVQRPAIPREGFAVNIIQHPAGMPKRVAARANLLKAAGEQELQYFGDTLGGSSGSPLFNDRWEVIGLHRASGPASGVLVKGKPASTYNVGIPIQAVLADIENNAPAVLAELKPAIAP